MNLNRYSFFDLDNTLYKGKTHYLILDFSTYLEANHQFDTQDENQLRCLNRSYIEGKINRDQFAIEVVKTYYHGLRGRRTSEIDKCAIDYLGDLTDQDWYPYTDPILELLKDVTAPILISGSPVEVIKHSKKLEGFQEIYGSKGSINSEVYTGEMEFELATEQSKAKLITGFNQLHAVDPRYSFAFGDSSSDFPLLSIVDPQNAYLLGAKGIELRKSGNDQWNYLDNDLKVFKHVRKRVEFLFH